MTIESKLSAIVANQLGRMQGALEVQVQEQVNTELAKFANQCPTSQELSRIIDARNNLFNVLNLFENKTAKFGSFTSRLQGLVDTLTVILTILRTIPIPTSVPPGIGIPIALTNKYAELLFNILRLLEAIEKDIESIEALVDSVGPFINNTKNRLNTLDDLITDCTNQLSEQQRNQLNTLTQRRNEQNTAGSIEPSTNLQFRSDSGVNYTIEVQTVQENQIDAPLRQAIAKNNKGVVVLRGQKSYSSSAKVLVDELKFRINNQLP